MTKKEIRLFATDLDGTLFSGWAAVSRRAADDLRQMRRKGIIIVLCSGRPFYSIRKNVPNDIYDYAICTNGQDIYEQRTGEHIYASFLEPQDIKQLVSLMNRYPVVMEAVIDDTARHYAAGMYRPLMSFMQKAGTIYKRMQGKVYQFSDVADNTAGLLQRKLGKVCFASFHPVLQKLIRQIDQQRMTACYTNPMWVEIMRSDVSKGNALRMIMEKEGIDTSQCAAAGDGENDITMFRECAVRIAMANAMPKLKQEATDLAGHCRKDGLAAWLEENIDF